MTTEQIPCDASPDCLHILCEHCGAGIRLSRSTAKDHPGTRVGTLKAQQCVQCQKRGGPPPPKPEHCVDCELPFRGRSEALADHPGTVQHVAHGKCTDCYRDERREEIAAYNREVERLKTAKRRTERKEHIKDERHVLLSDRQMSHIAQESPHMYWWHVSRRNRLELGRRTA